MRPYPLLLAMLAIALSQSSADALESRIQWRSDVQAAALEAKDAAKPLLIRFSTKWCGYCKKMQRETFANAKVIHHVEDCFVPVAIDGDVSRRLARQMGVRSFPTTFIMSPDMRVLAKIAGFRTPDQLSGELTKICAHDQIAKVQRRPPALTNPPESVFGHICPVSLVNEGSVSQGDPEIFTAYRGFRVTFQSVVHRDEFLRQPERYWPVADGRCVVTALDQEAARFGTLEHGLSFRGRIWLFASQDHQERFRQVPHEYFDKLVQQMAAAPARNRKPDSSVPVTAKLSDRSGSSRHER